MPLCLKETDAKIRFLCQISFLTSRPFSVCHQAYTRFYKTRLGQVLPNQNRMRLKLQTKRQNVWLTFYSHTFTDLSLRDCCHGYVSADGIFAWLLSLSVNSVSVHSGILIIPFCAIKLVAKVEAKSKCRLKLLIMFVAMATVQH